MLLADARLLGGAYLFGLSLGLLRDSLSILAILG